MTDVERIFQGQAADPRGIKSTKRNLRITVALLEAYISPMGA